MAGPLAHRMRPRELDDFVGQERVLGAGKPLRQWIETDRVPSLILWGPPGCGKTTLSRIIASRTQSNFESLSAVLAGVKDIKEVVEKAKQSRRLSRRKTILFVDEIHRFNKSQQDALLPHVEDGTLTLIGATTENPSFELNSALLSRTRVIRLERLEAEALAKVIHKALQDPERGLGGFLTLTDEAILWLASTAEGDARRALTALESVSLYAGTSPGALDLEQVKAALESALERQPIPYDKSGEEHYNVISAFIKSIRDSDPHAGLYYLARMLEGGEDPLFIARRLVILASEDVGNADPRGLMVAIAAKEAVDFVGMPEARINLGQAVTYLALAPKSNASYEGINQAIAEVRATGALPVPMHIRNAVTGLMKSEGYGKNYRYAHAQSGARAGQTHLPEPLLGTHFYKPKEVGFEKQLKEKLDFLNPDFGTKNNS
ncbi:MAG TPA: AAA family ATPase [Bdellovibrionales bacterium]|nr:MAG: AAA family ATPase [Bdellovibrionales bacterium GWB1_52_6]OFZ05310.1 MAG: AAA family ATPase [Bdellovibrionales bacterium GWA1_52_35]OFZ42800.1 MAG: AAA family ATPase [Bdellovibrionales bacterium GWC1_52_8]HAR41125.1 AAA family ATPase [Bdellovibrionales bacterium]HCM38598.1 AAA family ATPase [Bdellovibrionales bacterium]